jgi:hypothetical protein
MGRQRRRRRQRQIRDDVDGTWGSGDDPLGAHTPMAQNAILTRLGRLAAGRIDDWESLVDPTLSPGENHQIVLERGGELPAEEKRAVEKAIAATVDDRERSRAADLLRKNVREIRAGDRPRLAQDVAAEYGREFVDETVRAAIGAERAAEATPEAFGDAGESATVEPATATEPEPAPEPVEPTASPSPEPAEASPEREPAGVIDWGSLEPQDPEQPADPTPVPGSKPQPELGTGQLLGVVARQTVGETAREFARGARAAGDALRLAATNGGTSA